MAKLDRRPFLSVTIRDCEVQTFAVGGRGGAGKDTSNSGVRVIHRPSGARGEGREYRSQLDNKRAAFRRMAMTAEFQFWVRIKAQVTMTERQIRDHVDALMHPSNLRVEVRTEDGWKDVNDPGSVVACIPSQEGS